MLRLLHIVLYALLTVALMSTQSVAAGFPDNGKVIAEQWCASCHKVSAEQTQTMADIPTFSNISQGWGDNDQPLQIFLADPHPIMPNFNLTRNEIDDLIAYIRTLR